MVALIILGVLSYLSAGIIFADWMNMRSESEVHWSMFLMAILLWSVLIVLTTVAMVIFLLYSLVKMVYQKIRKKKDTTSVQNDEVDNTTTASE